MLLCFSLLSSASIDKKIQQSKKALGSKKIEYKKMDKELSSVAKRIAIAKKEQKKLTERIDTLSKSIKSNETRVKALRIEDKKQSDKLHKINGIVIQKQKKFLDLVAKNFSLSLALEEIKKPTPDSVMMREAYSVYEKENKKEVATLQKEIDALERKKSQLKQKQEQIKKVILNYENERKEYLAKRKKQDVVVQKLAKDRAIYKKRFDKIRASRKRLEKRLAKLHIIKKKRLHAKKVAAKNCTNRKRARQEREVTAYRGGKTISPLRGSRVIKRFGSYIDPIYKFKIFNKSITLKAPHRDAKVRSVLAGKVVFAENSGGMLGNVVIIEHVNNMHTIYAKLSRLAPGIHIGKKVSRATIIGKVSKSLMFEVTKNNKHVNPLTLINL